MQLSNYIFRITTIVVEQYLYQFFNEMRLPLNQPILIF